MVQVFGVQLAISLRLLERDSSLDGAKMGNEVKSALKDCSAGTHRKVAN